MNRKRRRLRSICGAKLVNSRGDVLIDGAFGDAQDFSDLPRRLAVSYPSKNFYLSWCEHSVRTEYHSDDPWLLSKIAYFINTTNWIGQTNGPLIFWLVVRWAREQRRYSTGQPIRNQPKPFMHCGVGYAYAART